MPVDPPAWLLQRRREIGDNLRDARLQRNLTQEKLAERAGIDRQAVGRIEAGHGAARLDTLLLLADALGVSLADLVRR